MGPTTRLDTLKMIKISYRFRESNHISSVAQPVACHYTDRAVAAVLYCCTCCFNAFHAFSQKSI
jgi:hypothetical protein